MPKLKSNWRDVLLKAWSVKFMLLAGALQGFSEVLPQFASMVPPGTFATLTAVASIAAVVSRLLTQANLDDTA